MRTILIGDIHGCADELEALLARTYAAGDRVISLGDILDRGPDVRRSLDLLYQVRAEGILGNHEDRHLRYQKYTELPVPNPVQLNTHHLKTRSQLLPEDWPWLAHMHSFIRIPEYNLIAVHAGILAGVRPEHMQASKLCRVQLTKPGSSVSPWSDWEFDAQGEPRLGGFAGQDLARGYRFWTDWWQGPEHVVYGHTVFQKPRLTEQNGVKTFGIDTGAVFGNSLSALVLPEWQTVSVPSRQEYCRRVPGE